MEEYVRGKINLAVTDFVQIISSLLCSENLIYLYDVITIKVR